MIINIPAITVKLNNPQMGTETTFPQFTLVIIYGCHVKLNNPQMGTETDLP